MREMGIYAVYPKPNLSKANKQHKKYPYLLRNKPIRFSNQVWAIDTLRNWELNGLLKTKRKENGYRVYNEDDIDILRIISTLRCANYSLSVILRLLNTLRKETDVDLEQVLNTPHENEDIVSVCDRLIHSLIETRQDVEKMLILLNEINENNEK